MGTRSTFQGVVRSYGGQPKQSGTTPGVLTMSEVIAFNGASSTSIAVSVGSTTGTNVPFVLPIGSVPLYFAVTNAAGTTTTATINFGTAANATSIANNLVVGVKGIVAITGTAVTAAGLSANTTVYANVGSTAGTGVVAGVFTYTVQDNAKPGEQAGY
jgi:hypothetical protein